MTRKATNNTNSTERVKHDSVPDKVVQKSVADDQFPQIDSLYCFNKVLKDAERKKKTIDKKIDFKKEKNKVPCRKRGISTSFGCKT